MGAIRRWCRRVSIYFNCSAEIYHKIVLVLKEHPEAECYWCARRGSHDPKCKLTRKIAPESSAVDRLAALAVSDTETGE